MLVQKPTIVLLAAFAAFATDARAVTIDWSPVGNPSNASDPATGSLYGAVGYTYKIGTHDVTNAQYAEFLNTKDPNGANTLALWNGGMADAEFGGINFAPGNANGSKYTLVTGAQNHPVTFVTWFDTVRFANWLNNGQGNGDTETGAYTLLHDGFPTPTPTPSNANTITRNAGATMFLPSESEWYKAAYYDPNTSSYNLYPTSNSLIPNASRPTAMPNSANYAHAVGKLTDVGAYTGTTSPYGAFDMGGNAEQWTESSSIPGFRTLRGGDFASDFFVMNRFNPMDSDPATALSVLGFRVAEIPEPSGLVLAAFGFTGLAGGWSRRLFFVRQLAK